MRWKRWMQNIRNLGDLIQHEMDKRDHMSAREFAKLVGVNHNTISAHINPIVEERPEASQDFLKKLAAAIEMDLSDLIEIANPGLVYPIGNLDADMTIINQMVKDFSPREKRMLIAFAKSIIAGRETP